MEEVFKGIAGYVALAVEVAAVAIIAFGALEAFLRILRIVSMPQKGIGERKTVWLRFGMWLLLGLEFELAADIVRSVITPSWQDIGQLGAIAVIRTFLNFFLERDLEKYAEPGSEPERSKNRHCQAVNKETRDELGSTDYTGGQGKHCSDGLGFRSQSESARRGISFPQAGAAGTVAAVDERHDALVRGRAHRSLRFASGCEDRHRCIVGVASSARPPKERKTGGKESYTIGLLAAAAVLSIVFVPFTLAVLGRIFSIPLALSPGAVAMIVLTTVLAPLAAGIAIHTVAPAFADRIAGPVSVVARIMLALGIVPVLFTQFPAIWSLVGNGTIVALAVFVVVGLAAGYLLGGPDPEDRTVLALSTSSRHPGVAATIAQANFPEQKLALAAVLLYMLVSAVVSVPYLIWTRRRHAAAARQPRGRVPRLPLMPAARPDSNPKNPCADGLSSPSGPQGAQTNFLRRNHYELVTCNGPDGPSPQNDCENV